MDYIKQLNAYNLKLITEPISTNARSIYISLLDLNNRLGWIEEFSISNGRLEEMSGLDNDKQLYRARQELIDNNYIYYKKGKGKKITGIYKIVPLYHELGQKDATFGSDGGSDHGSDLSVSTGALNKQNKTKQNKDNNIYITSAGREGVKQVTKYVYLKEKEIKRLRLDFDDEVVKRAIQILDNYKANNPRKTSGKEAYKDDNRAIRAWTIDKAQENIAKEKINNNRVKMSEKELAIVEKKEKYYSSKKEKNKVTVKNQHDERKYENLNKLYD